MRNMNQNKHNNFMQKKEIPIKMDNTNFKWINPKFEKNYGADGLIKFIISQLNKKNIYKRINSRNTNLL